MRIPSVLILITLLLFGLWFVLRSPPPRPLPVALYLPEGRAVVESESDEMAIEALCLLHSLDEKLERLLRVLEK